MVKECGICCEKYNATTRKQVVCGFCPHAACRTCVRTYLLGTVNPPHCMQCKASWNMDKMWEEFPKSFIDTELRKHQEAILLEREKARLPETQHEVFVEKQTRLYNALLPTVRLCWEYGHVQQKNALQGMLRDIEQQMGGPPQRNEPKAVKKDNFLAICPCPKEGCRGYIQKASHMCGLCGTCVCSKCRATKEGDGADHTCKPEDVETVKALKKETKPCPSCGTPLMKVDGCDQVWALCCKKAFSWRTGEFETKVHALDYMNYLRRAGRPIPRAEGDVPLPCDAGELPPLLTLRNALMRQAKNAHVVEVLTRMHRGLMHNQQTALDKYKDLSRPPVDPNFHGTLRKQYLLGGISEDEWKRRLILFERKRERQDALANVYALFTTTARDLMNEIVRVPSKAQENVDALQTLREYCNECFASVTRRFNLSPYIIGEDLCIARKAAAAPAT